VAAVVTLLRDEGKRLVTLTGPGGTGKTRLALQAARELAREHPNGVWFVSLAPVRDADHVPAAIAQTLGVRESAGQPLVPSLAAFLADRRVLLVLDNFEQVIDAAPLVSDLLARCPALSVLVTSRTPLRLYGERVYGVPPLALPDLEQHSPPDQLARIEAVRLFVERAQAVRSDFTLTPDNAAAVAGVCARLDGLPLAIELAAARSRLLSPQALLDRLDRRLPLLVGGPRDAPVRQQTLRDTIAWSHDLLGPEEQRLFGQLSVFVGGWVIAAAEAVCDADLDMLTGHAALVDHSLVRQVELDDGTSWFTMLETIREFAHERLAASGDANHLHQRLAGYLRQHFEAIWLDWGNANATRWLRQCERERDNLRSALAWAVVHDPETALRLTVAVVSYWWQRGQFSEARRWFELGLRPADRVSDAARANALVYAGMMATEQGDVVEGQRLAEEGLALARLLGADETAALGLVVLARIAVQTQDLVHAALLYEQSVLLFRATGGRWFGGTLGELSWVLIYLGHYDHAARFIVEALDESRRLGDAQSIAHNLNYSALLALRRGDQRRAHELLVESVTVQRPLRAPVTVAQTLEVCGWLACDQAQPERAARLLGAASKVRETMGTPLYPADRGQHDAYVRRAQAQIDAAAWDRAWAAGQALSMDEALGEVQRSESALGDASSAAGGLSPRELDVLRLLADGRSNQEIASALSISPRTVINHVASIMNKLGLDSRTAVAAWAIRRGLV
jgi:non-specific serine/threonine protein kinase